MSGRTCGVLFFFVIAAAKAQEQTDPQREVSDLRAEMRKLEARIEELEAKAENHPAAATAQAASAAQPANSTNPAGSQTAAAALPQAEAGTSGLFRGTTLNMLFDGYYGYNFNAPIGRVNRLRAYDVSSNNFSINQAAVVVENAPDPEHGKHWGVRLDLQWGQATETLQGNPANEPRPEIYRAIFQAYGTVVVPLGGKNIMWTSASSPAR